MNELIDAFVELVAERLKARRPEPSPEPAPSPSALDDFIAEQCVYAPGETVKFSGFCERFYAWLDTRGFDVADWGKQIVKEKLPDRFPYGVQHSNQRHIGNLKWVDDCRPRLVAVKGRLRRDRQRLLS
jgi:hypothetical protein